MSQEPKRPYYDAKTAHEHRVLREAAEVIAALPKGALALGKAIVIKPSDETMRAIEAWKKRQ